MRLWVIRHCETDFNREKRCQGTSDIPLNDKGRRQAEAVADYMRHFNLDAVYSSPSLRAVQTAQAFAIPAGIAITKEAGLMELNQGIFEGCNMEEMMRIHPEVLQQWISNPADTKLPEGESMRELETRVWQVVENIAKNHSTTANIAIVSHNLAISTIICKILGLNLNMFRKFRISPGGISVADFTKLGPVLVSLNITSHLINIED